MSIFIENPRFPEWISAWCTGGRNFRTIIAETYGGNEIRTAQWAQAKGEWDCAAALSSCRPSSSFTYKTIRDAFMVSLGQFGGMRFKDWNDYKDDGFGILGTGVGSSTPVYGVGAGLPSSQTYKLYSYGGQTYRATILKLVAGTFILKVNGITVVPLAVSTIDGTVAYTALDSKVIASNTPGATTHIVTTGALAGGIAVGKKVYVSGITGTLGAALNGYAWNILGLTVGGTNIEIDVATTGLSGTGGTAAMYYQASDTLTCTYEYDVPVRFAQDVMDMGLDSSGALQNWQQLKLIEIRNPNG